MNTFKRFGVLTSTFLTAGVIGLIVVFTSSLLTSCETALGGSEQNQSLSVSIGGKVVMDAPGNPFGHVIQYYDYLTAHVGGAGSDISYQWSRNGVPILGAIEQRYMFTFMDENSNITVTVTSGNKTGMSAPVAIPARQVTITISGKAEVGEWLTMDAWGNYISAYWPLNEWQRNGNILITEDGEYWMEKTYRICPLDVGATNTASYIDAPFEEGGKLWYSNPIYVPVP
jgi:hypothetical protein